MSNKSKVLLGLAGDILALYASLFLTLVLRYPAGFYQELAARHFVPFTLIFPVWLAVFYVFGLYDFRRLRNGMDFFRTLVSALFTNAVLSIFFFYFLPILAIAPKTNLFLFLLIFGLVEILWRRGLNHLATTGPSRRVVLWGRTEAAKEIHECLKQNPHLGYEVRAWIEDGAVLPFERKTLEDAIREHQADLVIVPRQFLKESRLVKVFFDLLDKVEVRDLPGFYEELFQRVPASEIDEAWFLENVARQHEIYEELKRVVDFLAAAIVQLALIPLEILIALAIRLTSRGPVIYSQVRVGRNGRNFVLYKFRTMRVDAEKDGPQWAPPAGDKRTTRIGRLLRYSHFDELPQLVNVLRGDLSFVGPRPERPEFVKILREQVPYYEIRSLIKPGITGWAQINYRKDMTVEDVKQKIQYDLYYLKNRSLVVDLAILLKTIKTFVSTPS